MPAQMAYSRSGCLWIPLHSAGVLLLCLLSLSGMATKLELPELDEIAWLVSQDAPPPGVIFEIREYDEDALFWVAPRLERYVEMLRGRFPNLPIAVLSHGDEMLALTSANGEAFARVHRIARRLVADYGLAFHVCGAFAAMNGLTADDFPDYIDVVPFGPSQVADYRDVGYELISLELTW